MSKKSNIALTTRSNRLPIVCYYSKINIFGIVAKCIEQIVCISFPDIIENKTLEIWAKTNQIVLTRLGCAACYRRKN